MKKFLSMLLSILMIATMVPYQALADDEATCDHLITAEVWANFKDSIKAENPDKEPNANGNGETVPAFVNAKLPASCEEDGWEISATDESGFCLVCGELVPDPTTGEPYYKTLKATGHSYAPNQVVDENGEDKTPEATWTVKTAPTCTEDGVGVCSNVVYTWAPTGSKGNYSPTYTATPCQSTTTIPATGHTWDDGQVIAPKCENKTDNDLTDGYTLYTCTVCGETEKRDFVEAKHNYVTTGQVVAPTCTEDGYTIYICTVCGKNANMDIVPATGHKYGDVIHTDPTCVTPGKDIQVCSVCNDTKLIKTYKALGHVLGADKVVETEATCTEDGIAVGTCTRCGERQVRVVIPATGHAWDDGKVTKEATCEADGVKTYTCTKCSSTYTKAIAKTGHAWGEWKVVEEATCEQGGKEQRVCANDATHIQVRAIHAKGHSWDDGVVTAPTCLDKGYTTYTCTVCGKTEVMDYVDALGHERDESKVEIVKYPTCEADGYDQAPCVRCGTMVKNILDATGHNFVSETVEPTCTTQGYTTYTCINIDENTGLPCSKTYTVDYKDALGHDWDEGVVTAPTCTENGYTTYTCQRCGEVKKENFVNALGHDYVGKVTKEATCTEEGVMTYTCTRCGDTYTEAIPMVAHEFEAERISYPTCEERGEVVYTCVNCGYIVDSFEEPTGHNFTDDSDFDCLHGKYCTNVNKNTGEVCGKESDERDDHVTFSDSVKVMETNDGTYYVAGDTFDPDVDVVSTGHHYVWTKTDATCEYDGYWVGTCDRTRGDISCPESDAIENETVTVYCRNTALGHDWALLDDGSDIPPTCTEEGTRHWMCLRDHAHTYTEVLRPTGHEWVEDETQYKAPTCGEAGEKVFVCKNTNLAGEQCTATYKEAVEPTGDHQYSDEITTAATCGADGVMTHTCKVCGYSYTTVIPATGDHTYNEEITKEATCTQAGVLTHKCKVCGYTYDTVIPKTAHQYIEDEAQYVAPTCTETGKRVYVCVNSANGVDCGHTYTQVLAATGHSWGKSVETPATCTANGYTTYYCTNHGCDASYKSDATPKIAHVLSVAEQKDATCGANGYVKYVCANCDYTETTTLDATGNHTYSDKTTKEASCTQEGEIKHTCDVCGYTYTTVTPKTGHQYTEDKAQFVAATCEKAGQRVYVCVNSANGVDCKDSYTEIIPATGHKYGKTVVVAPTCTADGYTEHFCVNDGCTESYKNEPIPKIAHVLSVAEQKDATCGANGYVKYVCANCDYTETTTLDATGDHKYDEQYALKKVVDKDGKEVIDEKTGEVKTVQDKATCGEVGHMDHICSVCGAKYTTEIPATGDHAFSDSVVEAATCGKSGIMDHVCETCGYTYTTEIPALSHNYTNVETPATCTTTGKIVSTCTNCGDVQTYIIPATGHIYDTKGVYTPPTCVEDGYTTYTCVVCKKESVTKTEGKAAGHVFKANVTDLASVNKDGTIATECIHCGLKSTKSIPAITSIKLSTTKYVYNGKACRPAVTVKDSTGAVISSGNYTLSYSSNKKIGTAKVTITFKGDYTGTVVKTFKIVPKNVGISDISSPSKKVIRFTWGKVAKCDGYQIQYSTSKTFKSKKTVNIKSRKTCVKKLTGLKSGKKYYIRVRAYKVVDGKKIYGNWSTATKICK